MARRLLGTGITNAQGIATLDTDPNGDPLSHSYTGVGAGKLDIVAESGTLQSETYEVLDTLYYDGATSDTSSNYTKSNCTMSLSTDKLVITRNADGYCYIDFRPTGTVLNNYLGKSLKFECDIIEATANVTTRIYQQVDGSWSDVRSSNTTSGTVSITSDIDANATAIQFRIECSQLGTSGTCSFRNFKVYPI